MKDEDLQEEVDRVASEVEKEDLNDWYNEERSKDIRKMERKEKEELWSQPLPRIAHEARHALLEAVEKTKKEYHKAFALLRKDELDAEIRRENYRFVQEHLGEPDGLYMDVNSTCDELDEKLLRITMKKSNRNDTFDPKDFVF